MSFKGEVRQNIMSRVNNLYLKQIILQVHNYLFLLSYTNLISNYVIKLTLWRAKNCYVISENCDKVGYFVFTNKSVYGKEEI